MLSPFLPSEKNQNQTKQPPSKNPRQKFRHKCKIHAYANSITINLLEIFRNEDMILCPW